MDHNEFMMRLEGYASGGTVSGSEGEINKQSSNCSQFHYIHFHANMLGKKVWIHLFFPRLLGKHGKLGSAALGNNQSRKTTLNLKPIGHEARNSIPQKKHTCFGSHSCNTQRVKAVALYSTIWVYRTWEMTLKLASHYL